MTRSVRFRGLQPPCCAASRSPRSIANIGIVVTGGAVRLTGSGLGCPTWPRCTDDSYTHDRRDGHPRRDRVRQPACSPFVVGRHRAGLRARRVLRATAAPPGGWLLALAVAACGIPAQAVIGGITVLTDLNPWVVGAATSCSPWR